MSRLFILLFSVLTLTGTSACAQAQDKQPDAQIADEWDLGFGEELEREKAETEEATRRAEEATRRAEEATRRADIIEDFLEIVEKPTD